VSRVFEHGSGDTLIGAKLACRIGLLSTKMFANFLDYTNHVSIGANALSRPPQVAVC